MGILIGQREVEDWADERRDKKKSRMGDEAEYIPRKLFFARFPIEVRMYSILSRAQLRVSETERPCVRNLA